VRTTLLVERFILGRPRRPRRPRHPFLITQRNDCDLDATGAEGRGTNVITSYEAQANTSTVQ
jgi:hypothetical protein